MRLVTGTVATPQGRNWCRAERKRARKDPIRGRDPRQNLEVSKMGPRHSGDSQVSPTHPTGAEHSWVSPYGFLASPFGYASNRSTINRALKSSLGTSASLTFVH